VLELEGAVEAAELPGGELVVAARGPLDERIAGELRATLIPLSGADGSTLVLDLGGAHGLDGAALLVICDAARLVHKRGARLGIVTRSPNVLRLLSDSGIDPLVDISPSLTEAMRR